MRVIPTSIILFVLFITLIFLFHSIRILSPSVGNSYIRYLNLHFAEISNLFLVFEHLYEMLWKLFWFNYFYYDNLFGTCYCLEQENHQEKVINMPFKLIPYKHYNNNSKNFFHFCFLFVYRIKNCWGRDGKQSQCSSWISYLSYRVWLEFFSEEMPVIINCGPQSLNDNSSPLP